MRVFVTGGAGFIGSHLVERLLRQNHSVTVYDNFSSGKREFIREHESNTRFSLVEGELLDLPMLKKAIKGHDMIFHLAANPDVLAGLEKTDLDLCQNSLGTYNVLESMRVAGITKIVFSSTSTVYGDVKDAFIQEDYGPLFPISLYGASKLYCEGLISSFCHLFGFQAWVFRFANVVGNRLTHGVIYDFIQKLKKNPKELKILGDGKQTKHYIFVEDLLDGIFFALKNADRELNYFNLSTFDSITVNEIAQIIVDEMGLIKVVFTYTGGKSGWKGDVPICHLNPEKLKLLGWEAKYSTKEAVRKSVQLMVS